MAHCVFHKNESDLINLKPWIAEFYKKYINLNEVIRGNYYVQCLKLNSVPSGKLCDYAIILVSDSDVQIYVKLTSESLSNCGNECNFYDVLRHSKGSIIKIIEFSISIDRLNSYEAPILIVSKFEFSENISTPKGLPKWIQEIKECSEHTKLLQMSSNINITIEKYLSYIPDHMLLTNCFNISSKNQILSDKIYFDFKSFSLLFDRLIISKLLNIGFDQKEIILSDITLSDNLTADLKNENSDDKVLVLTANKSDTVSPLNHTNSSFDPDITPSPNLNSANQLEPVASDQLLQKYEESHSSNITTDPSLNNSLKLDKNIVLFVESLAPLKNFKLQ
ncbi:hypothetical protein HZS_2395, partial [Henneguya salminicola]